MLEESEKQSIQQAYRAFLESRQLKARFGQKEMIAKIARLLGSIEVDSEGERISDPAVIAIEAGTGTGKTVGYALPAIVMAKAADKRLVIATATVALQEQVINKDLPDIIKRSGLQFRYTLAKGRGRYACISKLERTSDKDKAASRLIDMFGDDGSLNPDDATKALYQKMLESFASGTWSGDRDSWPDSLDDLSWRPITTDSAQCSGRRCQFIKNCPFFNARAELDEADVVVANHDLVLSDLSLGGGVILPAPKNTIYVFDEGHHLPDKAIDHFTSQSRVKSTVVWLEKASKNFQKMLKQHSVPGELGNLFEKLPQELDPLAKQLSFTADTLYSLCTFEPRTQFSPVGELQVAHHRFPEGIVPPELKGAAERLAVSFKRCAQMLERVTKVLTDAMDGDVAGIDKRYAEQVFPEMGIMQARMLGHAELWESYTLTDPTNEPPNARWVKWSEGPNGEELELFFSPIMSSSTLWRSLWDPSYACILTSATLAALGNFSRFRMRSGIPAAAETAVVPSPFHHQQAAQLVIPMMRSEPRNAAEHTQEIIELLPAWIDALQHPAGMLVLFSSRKQMNDVHFGLDPSFRDKILRQDDYSRQELLKLHKERIDDGKVSVLFGLASLAEGIDLPGNYCEHVVIAKIPFAVPDDPVEAALSEWLEAQGRNPFMEITVPDAAIRIIQACGRLLRTESDTGRITILDRRLVTARYGQMILNSLPPYQRIVE